MNLILFGAPGAGKGTQGAELVRKYGLVHISTGAMFRKAIEDKTPMGLKANEYIAEGKLVPDEVTVGLVKERLASQDIQKGFILDGFPRTLAQARCLDVILKELNIKLDYVISVDVKEEELLKRLTGRRMCKSCGNSFHVIFNPSKVEGVCDDCGGELYIRKDDNVKSVMVRLDAYNKQTMPVLKHYENQDILVSVDGNQEISKVFADIVNKLENKYDNS